MKSYLRFLERNKLYTAIEVVGLSIALAFILFIGGFLFAQFSTDREIKKKGDVYVASSDEYYLFSAPVKQILEDRFPEINEITRVFSTKGYVGSTYNKIYNGISERQLSLLVDDNFFEVLPIPLVAGEREKLMEAKHSVVLSKSCANRIFGNTNPIGQTLDIEIDTKSSTLTVTGIFEDFDNSVFPETDMIYNLSLLQDLSPDLLTNANLNVSIFLTLNKNCEITELDAKVLEILKKENDAYIMDFVHGFHIEKFSDIQFTTKKFHSPFDNVINRDLVRLFLFAGILLLLFAVLNYTSLTVAQTGFRAKEMASRRLAGAQKNTIIFKYILESFVLTIAAFGLSLLIYHVTSPYLSRLVGLTSSPGLKFGLVETGLVVLIIVTISVMSGVIPAMIASRYEPIQIVKGDFTRSSKMILSRIIIISQNTVATMTLSIAIIMFAQLDNILDKPLGYERDGRISINNANSPQEYHLDELSSLPFIEKVGWCMYEPMVGGQVGWSVLKDGQEVRFDLAIYDEAAIDILGFEIVSKNSEVTEGHCYMTESTMAALGEGYDCTEFRYDAATLPICGIIKDWQKGSLETTSSYLPLMLIQKFDPADEVFYNLRELVVKVSGDEDEAVRELRRFYEERASQNVDIQVHSYNFLFKDHYRQEFNNMKLLAIFTLLTLILCSLGMLAMSKYYIKQNSRTTAVKKIYGCSRKEIFVKMTLKFLSNVAISSIIAIPIALYIADKWLQKFTYRIDNSIWYYLMTVLAIGVIAMISISWQVLRASNENPVDALKKE